MCAVTQIYAGVNIRRSVFPQKGIKTMKKKKKAKNMTTFKVGNAPISRKWKLRPRELCTQTCSYVGWALNPDAENEMLRDGPFTVPLAPLGK